MANRDQGPLNIPSCQLQDQLKLDLLGILKQVKHSPAVPLTQADLRWGLSSTSARAVAVKGDAESRFRIDIRKKNPHYEDDGALETCPGKLWMSHPRKYSRPGWMRL